MASGYLQLQASDGWVVNALLHAWHIYRLRSGAGVQIACRGRLQGVHANNSCTCYKLTPAWGSHQQPEMLVSRAGTAANRDLK